MQAQQGAGGTARGVEPHRLARRCKRGVRQRKPQRLADNLRRGRGAQKLAASARRRAGAAAHFGGIFERDLLLRKACADGLHFGRVFARLGQQRDPAGHQHRGLRAQRRQRHHHRGQTLVACGHAHDAFARGQRAHQPSQHRCGIVAIGQRVHHACGALRAAVAGIGAGSRERRGAQTTSTRAQPRRRANPLPNDRCENPAQWLRRFPRASRRACSGSGIPDQAAALGPTPCRHFASGRRDFLKAQSAASPAKVVMRRQGPRRAFRHGANARRPRRNPSPKPS